VTVTVPAVAAPQRYAPVADPSPSYAPTGARRAAWYTLVGATAAFVGIQHALFGLQRELEAARLGATLDGRWWETASLGRFLAFSLAALLLVGVGRRRVFVLPVLAAVLVPAIAGPGSGLFPPGPSPLGFGWAIRLDEFAMPHTGLLWTGVVVDSTLALAPAALLAWRSHVRPPRTAKPSTALDFSAMALCGLLLVLYAHVRAVGEYSPLSTAEVLAPLVPIFVLGLLAGARPPWWPWAVVALALLPAGETLVPLIQHPRLPEPWEIDVLWPPIAAGLLGSAWPFATRLLSSVQRKPVTLVVAVNMLNIADAVLTMTAINANEAVEANPVASTLGMPAKIVLVAVASIWLARRYPQALIWPMLGLTAVFSWHVAGLALRP